ALLLSDEAYYGVLYDGREHLSPASQPELSDRTLVLRSFSKTLGMAAWRIAYAVGPEHAIHALARELQWQALAIDGVAQSAALAAPANPVRRPPRRTRGAAGAARAHRGEGTAEEPDSVGDRVDVGRPGGPPPARGRPRGIDAARRHLGVDLVAAPRLPRLATV